MQTLLLLIAAYFIGNLSPAFILGKVAANIDIREYGSGNAGTTNVMRVMGAKAGVFVLLADVMKGVAAVWIGRTFGGETIAVLCGFLAVIGHNWPILLKFKGGKGAATTMGVALMIHAPFALICIGLAGVIIVLTKYVSLASIIGIPIWTTLLWLGGSESSHVLLGTALSILVLYRHRSNIQRIINGSENRVDIKKKLDRS
ncbi:MAG: glycerol-3-phosphate 1-O-acyltransferase PlsY [Bacillota bacterium]|nr:glycerol-3-phosphate 1-O-acyltransferase PlsY [Bacillota bacterium]MDW7676463.1 glycerol-3-phosphate 1-O-acyltransferase PlsY [Bacillota bacterium]